MRSAFHSSTCRGLTLALLVCALAMRMIVPSGFMLMPAAHGATLVICPGQGAMPAPMAHNMAQNMAMPDHAMAKDHGGAHKDKHQDSGDCSFAPAGAVAAMAFAPPSIIPAIADRIASPTFHSFAQPGRGLAAPPPPKTGPPIA